MEIIYSILEYKELLNFVLPVLICVFFFLMLYCYVFLAIGDRYAVVKQRVMNQVDAVMTRSNSGTFSYDALQEKLDSLGVTYRSDGKITPLVYLSYKFLMVLVGFLLGINTSNLLLGIVFAVVAWFLPDIYYENKNKHDNVAMLYSIMDVYDVILLQIGSGVSITRIMIDAYWVVDHPRLKSALLTLTGDIVYLNDLNVAMEAFNRKFKNESLREFVILVKQLSETGSAKDMIEDIKKHTDSLQEAYNDMERRKYQRIGDILAILVFIGIIALIMFAAVQGLGDVGNLFSV